MNAVFEREFYKIKGKIIIMTRHDLRDATFRIIFQIPFHRIDEMTEQEENFLLDLADEPEQYLSEASSLRIANEIKNEEEKIVLASGETDHTEETEIVSEKDKEYIRNKVQGILMRLPEIDNEFKNHSTGWDISRIGRAELAILRLAVYEIKFDEDIPVKVAVNEAVELAKKYCDDNAYVFVNGILSTVMKED